ncbi:MAG: hypothetical protein KF708_10600 [Pirellulales bacterium]|nr:hypothetical protein [Pirellulales bacterium]
MLIEQAVFTSAQTDWSSGYRLVSTSPGVRDVDAQELSNWGPSHDSLWEEGADASSVNFHRLPSGAYCVSRTTPAGAEYSGRRGPQIYTQCLLVNPELLARFSNNPFALLRAVIAQGSLRVHNPVPARLTPIRLVGRAAPFDQALVGQLADDPGSTWLSTLVQALVEEPRLGLMVGNNGQRVVQGLIHCLPTECRAEFSFSTGLRYSPRRPFRLICLPPAKAEARRLERRYDLRVLDLSGDPPREFEARDGWACFVDAALERRKMAWFGGQLAQPRPELDLEGLNSLGRRLMAQMSGASGDDADEQGRPAGDSSSSGRTFGSRSRDEQGIVSIPLPTNHEADDEESSGGRRADGAHRRFEGTAAATLRMWENLPAEVLGAAHPDIQHELETLDDTVFEAIAGNPAALMALRQLWPALLQKLGAHGVGESREQYLRHALNVWRQCIDGEEIRDPRRAIRALDVLGILYE